MPILKVLFVFLGISGLIYLALCSWLWLGQRQLMFLPTPAHVMTPADMGVSYQDVWISVEDAGQSKIHGWWLPALGDSPLTFLYLHGNAGNISSNLTRAVQLHGLGASVLTIDYRGYGLSSGPFPDEQQFYDDAWAALDFLTTEKEINPENLVIYGHSLGGAIAIHLAHQVPQLAALMVESSFTSMADMAALSHYNRWFPVQQLLTQKFDSLSKVKTLRMPVLYLHGLADATVPAAMSQQLYQATTAPADLWLVPNADHNDLTDWTGDEFIQRLTQFLGSLILVNP
jgi:pimeloyl-ACP methyl ester carboxylesterase